MAVPTIGAARHSVWAWYRARLMAAEFVRPYRKRQSVKNDRADAEAILVVLLSPGMRFIPVKTEAQEQRLAQPAGRLGGRTYRAP